MASDKAASPKLSKRVEPSGGSVRKETVAFQVPKDASVIEIEFQENLLSGKAAIFSFEK